MKKLIVFLLLAASYSFAQAGSGSGVSAIQNPGVQWGIPNGVTVGGSSVPYYGADLCDALQSALNNTLTGGSKFGGVFNVTGFKGDQVCSVANLNALNAALQATTGATTIQLGCPLNWYIPLQTSQAATVGSPAVGSLNVTPYDEIYGCNAASVADNQTTHIIACPPTGITGCTAPQTAEWPITSTVASSSGATINDRAYIQVNASGGGMNIVGGQPFTIDGGMNGQIAGSYTACQVSNTVAISGFSYVNPNITFTNTGTNGLSAGSPVILSGFSGANVSLNAAWTVASSADGQHFVINVGAGFGGSTAAGSAQTGNTNVQNDAKCPFNPSPTTVYAAMENGIQAVTFTGGAAGTYDSNLTATFGAGCIINPDIHFTFTGGAGAGVINGAFIRHAGKCNSTPTCTVADSTGTVGGATCTVFTAQSTAASQATGNCSSNCGIIHSTIPLIEVVDNSGTNQNAPMGSKVHDLIIDLRQTADAECYRDLGGNEHTRIYNINCTGFVTRGMSRWTKQTNSGDDMYSIRGVVGKLPNQATPFATNGACTMASGVCTSTSGNGFFYGLNASNNPACVYAVNTPIVLTTGGVNTVYGISTCSGSTTVTFSNGTPTITGFGTTLGAYAGLPVHFKTTGTMPTNFTAGTTYYIISANLAANVINVSATPGGSAISAGSAGSGTFTIMTGISVTVQNPPANGSYTYYVPGVDLGTECFYASGGFGHGLKDYTCDYSAATSQMDYPYITSQVGSLVQRLPQCGVRAETNYFGTTIMDGHTERSLMNVCAGLGAPVYGLNLIDVYGEPNANTNITGAFQNYHPTNIKFFNDYYSNSLNTTATQQYTVVDAPTSFNSYYSLVDDNPVGPAFTAGPADPFNLSFYGAEWSAIQTSAGNTVCVNVNSTIPGFGNYSSCPNTGFLTSGNSPILTANTSGITSVTGVLVMKGFTPNQTYHIHCSGTTTQAATANGFTIVGAAAAPVTSVTWNMHAMVSTSSTVTAGASSGAVVNTAATTNIYTPAAGTATTELPWTVDGYITIGASAPLSWTLGFSSASGAVTVMAGSYCGVVP